MLKIFQKLKTMQKLKTLEQRKAKEDYRQTCHGKKKMKTPHISIVVPYHDTPKTAFFLSRLLKSIEAQTFKDYEIVLLKKGRMAETYNEAIQKSQGEYIKLMGMDDYFLHEYALERIATELDAQPDKWWVASACVHDDGKNVGYLHSPQWNDKLYEGFNTIGGFACITIRNKGVPVINEELDWVVDVDWYWRIKLSHGLPLILTEPEVVIGIGEHQTTNTLSEEQKAKEHAYTKNKYENK